MHFGGANVTTTTRHPHRLRSWAALLALVFVATACASETQGSPDASSDASSAPERVTLEVRVSPSQVAFVIAQDKGFYEILDLEYTLVGYGESAALFIAGEQDVAFESPWEAARFQTEGEDIVFFGTPSSLAFYSGLIIRAEDEGTITSLEDLRGKKVGHPGFGTGTWAAFEIITQELAGMDARTDFEPVEGGPGALLGLLETGEIDATINFTGQTATALTRPDDFHVLVNFTEAWEAEHGEPLVINGVMARRDWLESNEAAARDLVAGAQRGLEWMKENPDAFRPGGEYASFVEGEGWLADDATNDKILELLLAGTYYLEASEYDQAWIDSMYEFIQQGEGILADTIPPKEDIFYPPERVNP